MTYSAACTVAVFCEPSTAMGARQANCASAWQLRRAMGRADMQAERVGDSWRSTAAPAKAIIAESSIEYERQAARNGRFRIGQRCGTNANNAPINNMQQPGSGTAAKTVAASPIHMLLT